MEYLGNKEILNSYKIGFLCSSKIPANIILKTYDWTIRKSASAKLMVLVRRTLTKYGYPPDKQQKAIDTVLKQAELIADELIK
ncbi:MAG: hypothetical protein DAHOPDDO_00265 [Ignavibacteriaceae bacterium]|nr:hypothetical protein [Ignavibacteriaceae bacterium]